MTWAVRLYGNDSTRPVRAHIDDLHPDSTIRRVLLNDRKRVLRCGFSRSALRSLVSSYRHNQIIALGKVSVEELRAELERDCAPLQQPLLSEGVNTLLPFMRRVAYAIEQWPLLQSSMQSGSACDWSSSTFHCKVQVPAKKPLRGFQARPGSLFLDIACRVWMEAKGVPDGAASLDGQWEALSSVPAREVVGRLREMVSQQGPLWHLRFDDYGGRDRRGRKSLTLLSEEIRGNTENASLSAEWTAAFRSACHTIYAETIDLAAMLESPWAIDTLQAALGERGYTATRLPFNKLSPKPLVLATMWHDSSFFSPIDDLLLDRRPRLP